MAAESVLRIKSEKFSERVVKCYQYLLFLIYYLLSLI